MRFIPDGAIVPGVVHGVVIFAILAAVLGASSPVSGTTRRLMWTLPLAGLLLAAAFYPIAMLTGYLGGLLVTWVGMWLSLALLYRWARRSPEPLGGALARAAAAAVFSGLAFWAVSGMWTNPAETFSFLTRTAKWAFAYFPGFAALLLARADDKLCAGELSGR